MRILRSLAAVPVLSATLALAACSAGTTASDESEQEGIGSAQQEANGCPAPATLQQCSVQTPCNLNLGGCDYSSAQLPGFYNTGNMQGTSFAGANLSGAFLGGNTAGASFAGADLSGATLSKNANGADFSGATVSGTTVLGNTNNVSCANLVVGTIPGSSPPAADLPTGLPSACFGNVNVTCPPPSQCFTTGVANQATQWQCQYSSQPDGTACNDGAACTQTDTCQAGVCTGTSNPCQNGGACVDGVTSYTCSCAAGYQGSTCQDPVSCASGLPAPTVFWKGENNALDSSGNGWHGVLRGATFAGGEVGQAFNTTAGDVAITTSAPELASLDALTIDMWINIDDATGYQVLFSRNRGVGGTGYAVGLNAGRLLFGVNNGAGVNQAFQAPTALSLHTWHHITVSRQANVVKLYADCALIGQSTTLFAGTINLSAARPVTIGSEDTVVNRRFRGLIDEVILLPTQLSDTEVSSICAAATAGVCTGVQTCVPTTCAAQGATCGTIPDGCGGTLTCGAACGSACPCDADPAWQSALAGTIVTDGRCTDYSFPAPCGSQPDFSFAVTQNGTSLVELMGGTQVGQMGAESFCGVQVMQPAGATNCSGGSFPVMLSVTEAEGAACRAEILALAAAQNATCH